MVSWQLDETLYPFHSTPLPPPPPPRAISEKMLTWMRILPGLLLHNSLNEAQAYIIRNFSKGLSLSQFSWCSEFWAQVQLVIPDLLWIAHVVCCSVAKLTVHDSMGGSTSGFSVFHYILEYAQAHVHWVQQWCCLTISFLCHPLLLWLQSFPAWRFFSNELALCVKWPKYWSFSISSSNECWFLLELSGLISLQFKGLSRVFSSTTI